MCGDQVGAEGGRVRMPTGLKYCLLSWCCVTLGKGFDLSGLQLLHVPKPLMSGPPCPV